MSLLTTTSPNGLGYGTGSVAGYVDGWWYVFESNGTNIVYGSTNDPDCSPDSIVNSATAKAGADGSYFDVIFQGVYCYLVSCTPDSNPIKMRRGLCSGGWISWDSEVTAATGTQMRVTSLDITEDGHLLIGYYADASAWVTRNENTDGTWSTSSGYPKKLNNTDGSEDSVNMYVKVLDLGSGAWMGLYCGVTGGHIYGRYWNGSTLAAREQCSDIICSATARWDARAYGSTVYLAWNAQDSNFHIRRRARSSGSWGTAANLATLCNYYHVPAVSVNKNTGDVFVAWQGFPSANHVYYAKYTALTSSWGSVVDAANEITTNTYHIVGLSQAMGNSVLFFYLNQSSSPYRVYNIWIESLTASAGGVGPSGGVACGGILII